MNKCIMGKQYNGLWSVRQCNMLRTPHCYGANYLLIRGRRHFSQQHLSNGQEKQKSKIALQQHLYENSRLREKHCTKQGNGVQMQILQIL